MAMTERNKNRIRKFMETHTNLLVLITMAIIFSIVISVI
jgi:hypothetical protein